MVRGAFFEGERVIWAFFEDEGVEGAFLGDEGVDGNFFEGEVGGGTFFLGGALFSSSVWDGAAPEAVASQFWASSPLSFSSFLGRPRFFDDELGTEAEDLESPGVCGSLLVLFWFPLQLLAPTSES